jgi:transcriptional regulator with XRE-family HTH domain
MTRLKAERLRAGLTGLRLAELTKGGTTENRLFQLERGRFKPRAAEAAALARALGLSVETLFPEGTQPANCPAFDSDVLDTALWELAAFERKYSELQELADVFAAIKRVQGARIK